jgi:hypothetical protein
LATLEAGGARIDYMELTRSLPFLLDRVDRMSARRRDAGAAALHR